MRSSGVPAAHGVDDGPDRRPDLVVGVGGGDDAGAVGRDRAPAAATGRRRRRPIRRRGGRRRRRPRRRPRASPVAPASTVTARASASGARAGGRSWRDSRWGRWTTTAPSSAGAPPGAGGSAAAARAGPPRRTSAARGGPGRPGGGARRPRPAALVRGQRVEGAGRRGRAARGRRRPGRPRWPGARRPARTAPASAASAARRAAASTGVDTGRRPAPASAGGAEQLGQAVGGEEGDGGHARRRRRRTGPSVPDGQEPPGGHADVVGGHDDGDRRQRVAALGGATARPQRLGRLRRPYRTHSILSPTEGMVRTRRDYRCGTATPPRRLPGAAGHPTTDRSHSRRIPGRNGPLMSMRFPSRSSVTRPISSRKRSSSCLAFPRALWSVRARVRISS